MGKHPPSTVLFSLHHSVSNWDRRACMGKCSHGGDSPKPTNRAHSIDFTFQCDSTKHRSWRKTTLNSDFHPAWSLTLARSDWGPKLVWMHSAIHNTCTWWTIWLPKKSSAVFLWSLGRPGQLLDAVRIVNQASCSMIGETWVWVRLIKWTPWISFWSLKKRNKATWDLGRVEHLCSR